MGRSLGSQGRSRSVTISPLICRALMLINCQAYRGQSTGHDIKPLLIVAGVTDT
jgi:hypothetical protein